ncbi:protein of unknown function [Xenorhabdus poinarii G6]|uniref:Uncharacterized protein n=1 Tax=Xenorhabdus poinarii G6 TaxID=1354304 RepID=A0A068R2G7_9GAMM|nr:hypothetical protein [Xenorhabdus poinarii]CDG21368.1 protein of unknown function [Xenorhabdus poinarii G6]
MKSILLNSCQQVIFWYGQCPTVGKGERFLDWIIREHDRKIAVLEMELAGVHDVATVRSATPRTFMLL